ncbi:glycosyltransferase family 2 protein [Deinococcus yavapaiensis]|uniref:Glycosyltransferase involved in cell wall biosynthesis n=1 Tax=Deinococcus yavapaiensis KR-236 TaxID=694435 RepID=A0A318SAZ5_9DEIO|nr:glycosyltransferase family 2 protein [Deinococcus yavapaiensis]PYE55742.1 glycosyltransferase involved in cell wall biosynthesis [Deinococcus yavapaiensis KR-236]
MSIRSFSVIVALHNAERYLTRTLDALRAQTWRDFEVVMVDDGSTDASAEIAARYRDEDPRFTLLRTPNRGISPARNLAVRHSGGDWLAVCDADDTWHPEKLERQAAFIERWNEREHEPIVALGTSGLVINARDVITDVIDVQARPPWRELTRTPPIIVPFLLINSSVVMRRDAFDHVGGYRADYTPTEDTDLWVRLSEVGAVVNLPELLMSYRVHGTNVSEGAYIGMLLNAQRVFVNADRRANGLPEWTRDEYDVALRTDPERFRRVMRTLRHLAHYNKGRIAWDNDRKGRALWSLALSMIVDAPQTMQRVKSSRILRQLVRREPAPTLAPKRSL